MTKKHALIILGSLAAVGALVYLASMREVNATITAGDAEITYRSDEAGKK
jgi:hypothetical protein